MGGKLWLSWYIGLFLVVQVFLIKWPLSVSVLEWVYILFGHQVKKKSATNNEMWPWYKCMNQLTMLFKCIETCSVTFNPLNLAVWTSWCTWYTWVCTSIPWSLFNFRVCTEAQSQNNRHHAIVQIGLNLTVSVYEREAEKGRCECWAFKFHQESL